MTITTRQTSGVGVTAKNAPLTNAELDQNFIDLANGNFAQIQQSTVYPRASIRPSLLLDFANSKTLDPRITYTRASTASYYDGKTTAKAEENLAIYSQEFDNSSWSKAGASITSNSTTAPDGTTTADSYVAAVGTDIVPFMSRTIPGSVDTYTFSVYAKVGTHSYLQLAQSNGVMWYANFDLTTGTLGTTDGSVTSSIVSVGNGWYRCVASYSATSTAGVGAVSFLVNSTSATRGTRWNPAGTETVYLWGAQLEQRSTATSYTPTTSSPITNYIPALQTAVSNEARFDHDPVTGESKGLLIEEQRTNLLTYSDQFENAAWPKAEATIASNIIVAPDGTLTGDKIVDTTVNTQHYVRATASFTSATVYTTSFYAKAAEYIFVGVYLSVAFSANPNVIFNLNNGTYTIVTSGNSVSATITPVGNGWYRCTVTATADTTSSNTAYPRIRLADNTGSTSFAGTGSSGIYIWGAQLEAGSFATSYIPTVASQVTRSADAASMTGANFSSWYRQDEGSIYVEALANNYATTGAQIRTFAMLSNDDETTSSYFGRGATVAIRFAPKINGVNQTLTPTAAYAFGSITVGQTDKFVLGYSSLTPSLVLNGTKATDNTSPYIQPRALTTLRIGGVFGGNSLYNLNGYIKRLAYYPKRLSNTELQGITS